MKKNIFLTGATGTMGFAGLKEIVKRNDKFNLTILARPSKTNKKKLKQYNDKINIVWGDLTKYQDVLKATQGADYVLHVGGMVSPKADKYPEKTLYVNITSAQNVAKAVLSQPNAEDIKVVYIGSVAQTGSKLPPNQWGRTGDLQKPALYDNYAVSKILAEQAIVDSGIKKWVSLRQSGILYPELIKKGINAITFHVPINGVLEWTTAEDSGQLLANVCEDFVPDEFWNRFIT